MSNQDVEIGFILGQAYGSLQDLNDSIKGGHVDADTVVSLMVSAFKSGQDNAPKPVEPLADWEKELLTATRDPKGRMPGDVLVLATPYGGYHCGHEFKVISINVRQRYVEYVVETARGAPIWGPLGIPSDYFANN